MAQKPSIPKGTRDFSPTEVAKRNYIFSVIKQVFEVYGFQPIETPSFENSSTLMGKYGDEGDRLIFKILNSGDFLKKVDDDILSNKDSSKVTSKISEKALRYDLTVPFARYVVQHQNDIEFPFKRYQMQPVWRADRPQKGRFREFYQCDADVVGSKGLWQEVEFVQLYDAVFSKLKLKGTTIKLNNRKILAGIAEIIGETDKLIDFTVALDKLDKIGAEGVTNEMVAKGISENAIEKVQPLFSFNGSNQDKLNQLEVMLAESNEGLRGVEDLRFVVSTIEKLGLQSVNLVIDVTLARGLNYYTGAIYEVSAPEGIKMGSIGGGGRYDDLTGIFGLKDMSGVGISFGLDRIYLVLEELNLFEEVELPTPKILFINLGEAEATSCLNALVLLRKNNIKSELYPENVKMKKQFNYANKREIPYVIIVGSDEVKNNNFTVKNMKTGDQKLCSLEELLRIDTLF
ncbi:MAG: histidine--tRNA ligase [Lutibacter sp.]|uniref:histidine--tRNA ligase n=1 Tax=Lutibacter sp. TaxID=1925666 RepID=UPI0017A1A702|nr:histidine--tRNA ligase [Lutibacter sp.]MBT8317023.1 histidine--tRNA ligase [Lutibacter sp.]NNJ57883.1 histidine--tRNA ligase [Lutibacter sp.]